MFKLFGCDKMNMGTITARIRDMLETIDPIVIHHKIKLGACNSKTYNLEVEVDYPFSLEIMPFLSQKVVIDERRE